MTIKNADMPAMPITDESGMPFSGLPLELSTIGLTKREMMAMHMMAASRSRSSNYSSWVDMATDAIEMTDALLAALERTK